MPRLLPRPASFCPQRSSGRLCFALPQRSALLQWHFWLPLLRWLPPPPPCLRRFGWLFPPRPCLPLRLSRWFWPARHSIRRCPHPRRFGSLFRLPPSFRRVLLRSPRFLRPRLPARHSWQPARHRPVPAACRRRCPARSPKPRSAGPAHCWSIRLLVLPYHIPLVTIALIAVSPLGRPVSFPLLMLRLKLVLLGLPYTAPL